MVAPDDSGDGLGRQLGTALADLGSSEVDAQALLRRSTRRAQVVRGRRVVAVGVAGALLIALPLGYEIASRPDADPPVAALVPSDRPTSRTPGYPRRTIPDTIRLPEGGLGSPLFRAGDVQDAAQPPVAGQTCDWVAAGKPAGPVAARTWTFDNGPAGAGPTVATVTVTGWGPGQAERAFPQVRSGSGACRWNAPQRILGSPFTGGDEAWQGVSGPDSPAGYARTVVRKGSVIIGVEVRDAKGLDEAILTAGSLADQTLDVLPGS
jgi:hypothetical protein